MQQLDSVEYVHQLALFNTQIMAFEDQVVLPLCADFK
jgi:hypothetical protein